jgi:hypothetical protein
MAAESSQSLLLRLPAELRLEIYDRVFAETRPIDLLSKKGPGNALLATCKQINAEAARRYEKTASRHATDRADLLDELITKYEEAVSPHFSVVFWPPICRAATLMRSVNDLCLHACAKDGCYMCDDKAHRQCFDCGRNVAIALWCYDNPEDTPALVVKGSGGTKLTELGRFIKGCQPLAERRMRNRVDKSKVDRWWQRELDMQVAVDYRCELRRVKVEEFWSRPIASATDFTAANISAMEEADPGMEEYWRAVAKHGEEGFLDWEPEYERRVKQRQEQSLCMGIQLPPQIPTKRTEEKLKALQHRFKVTTPVGRYNSRVRGRPIESCKAPLLERRTQHARARGFEMQTLILAVA